MNSLWLVLLLTQLTAAKVVNCRNKLKGNDNFVYCTKFSSPANAKVEIDIRSRILNGMEQFPSPTPPMEPVVFFEVGVFSDA